MSLTVGVFHDLGCLLPDLHRCWDVYAHAGGSSAPSGPGKVFLVGTGPGDPGLLTLRAVQLMQTADVVLYDRLVSEDILRLVHGGARMVYVGKQAGFHTRTQVSANLGCHLVATGTTAARHCRRFLNRCQPGRTEL